MVLILPEAPAILLLELLVIKILIVLKGRQAEATQRATPVPSCSVAYHRIKGTTPAPPQRVVDFDSLKMHVLFNNHRLGAGGAL